MEKEKEEKSINSKTGHMPASFQIIEAHMGKVIEQYRTDSTVAFAHSISADLSDPGHMTAGVAVVFKAKFGKPKSSECLTPHLALQVSNKDAPVYSLITKSRYYKKPFKKDYDIAFRDLMWSFKKRGLSHLICSPMGCVHDRINLNHFIDNLSWFQKNTNAKVTIVTYSHNPYQVLKNGMIYKDFVQQLRELISLKDAFTQPENYANKNFVADEVDLDKNQAGTHVTHFTAVTTDNSVADEVDLDKNQAGTHVTHFTAVTTDNSVADEVDLDKNQAGTHVTHFTAVTTDNSVADIQNTPKDSSQFEQVKVAPGVLSNGEALKQSISGGEVEMNTQYCTIPKCGCYSGGGGFPPRNPGTSKESEDLHRMVKGEDIGIKFSDRSFYWNTGPIILTERGTMLWALKNKASVEMTVDQGFRILDVLENRVIVVSPNKDYCLVQGNTGSIMATNDFIEITAYDLRNKNDKYCLFNIKEGFMTFSSRESSIAYTINEGGIGSRMKNCFTPMYIDISYDIINLCCQVGSEYKHAAVENIKDFKYALSPNCTQMWRGDKNGVKISYTTDGDMKIKTKDPPMQILLTVNHKIGIKTPYLHITSSKGLHPHLYVKKDKMRTYYDGLNFVCRNGGQAAGFDRFGLMKIFSRVE